jgi:hypothetical protein
MIKVDKEVTITISGEDVDALSAICELAHVHLDEKKRGYLETNKLNESGFAASLGLTGDELVAVHKVINSIFSA